MKFKHIIMILFALSIVFTSILSYKSKIVSCLIRNKEINGLIIGTDYVDHSYHADSIILLNYDSSNRIVNIISIPRDTKVDIPDLRIVRLADTYAFHHKRNKNHYIASKAFVRTVETILKNKLPISFYIRFDYKGFKEIMNAVGKLNIEIEKPMRYTDKAQNLIIDLKPGLRSLDSEDLLKYIRYRDETGDMGRMRRQQKFIKEFVKNIKKNPFIALNLKRVIDLFGENIHTNLTFYELVNLLLEFRYLSEDSINIFNLPGKIEGKLWKFDPELFDDILQRANILKTEKKLHEIKVKVSNASAINKAAYEVRTKLLRYGFYVHEYGDYQMLLDKTLILDYTGCIEATKKILNIIGIGEIYTKYDKESKSDIEVVIGKDYEKVAKISKVLH